MALIIRGVQTELEFIKEQLALRTWEEWHDVAEGSEVPFSSIKKLAYGQTKGMHSENSGKLYRWLMKHRRRVSSAKRTRQALAA